MSNKSNDSKTPKKRKKNLIIDHPLWDERLSEEWDYEKNEAEGIRPDEVTAGSRAQVHWKCLQGHEWVAFAYSRTTGIGCPYCAGKRPIVGETDLQTVMPDLANEWHPTKNGDLTPKDVMRGTEKRVWWLGTCVHEWDAKVSDRARGYGCPYCSGKRPLVGVTDLGTIAPELAKEWHPTKNAGLTPQDVTRGNNKKVWWRCEHGHEWQAAVPGRIRGTGCPYCAGKRPIPGETDLASIMPDLAREWHPTRNGELTPQDVTKGSNKRVWWFGECGHEWQAKVAERVRGSRCPYCAGRIPLPGETDLATVEPALAREWHPTKNGALTPMDVTRSCGRRVFWQCEQGHEWQATIDSRTRGNGCPYCAGKRPIPGETDLATFMPELAKEWHPTKNGDLTPRDVTVSSGRNVIWQCEHGHEWKTAICNRSLRGSGCPYCAGQRPVVGETDLQTVMPELAKEWHPTKNGKLTPRDVMRGSSKKVWWLCSSCGHEWKALICERGSGTGCPKCASSHGEKDSATWAESVGFVVSEQWRDPKCCDKRPLPFDLMLYASVGNALMEIALVEYDGQQHSCPDAYFNMKSLTRGRGGFSYVQKHDRMKDAFCEATGRHLIRVPHTVKGLDSIASFLESAFRSLGLGYLLD